jgi:antitoxin ChpS
MDSTNFEERVLHRYTFEELLAQCDESATSCEEDQEWLDSPPVGRELL